MIEIMLKYSTLYFVFCSKSVDRLHCLINITFRSPWTRLWKMIMLLSQFCFYHHIVFYESLFLYSDILWQEVMRDYRKFYSQAAWDTCNYSSFSSLFKFAVTQGKVCGTTIYIAFHKVLINIKGLGERCILPSPSRIKLFLSCLCTINLINIVAALYGRLIFILKIVS